MKGCATYKVESNVGNYYILKNNGEDGEDICFGKIIIDADERGYVAVREIRFNKYFDLANWEAIRKLEELKIISRDEFWNEFNMIIDNIKNNFERGSHNG